MNTSILDNHCSTLGDKERVLRTISHLDEQLHPGRREKE
jgi:hypothetical protein